MPVSTNGLTIVNATSVAVSGDSSYAGNLTLGGGIVASTANVNGPAAFAGDVWVGGNLHLLGNTLITNVAYQTSDSLNVTNFGTGPALVVYQGGNWPIANLADQYGTALFVGNAACVTIGSSVAPTSGNVARVAGNLEVTGSVFGNGAGLSGLSFSQMGGQIANTQLVQTMAGNAVTGSTGGIPVITSDKYGRITATQTVNYSASALAGNIFPSQIDPSVWSNVAISGNLSVGGLLYGNGSQLTGISFNYYQPWQGISVGNTWANANVGVFGNVNVSQRIYSSGLNATGSVIAASANVSGTVVGSLFNTTSGSVTLTASQATLFTVASGTSGFLVIAPTSTSLTKGLWWFEYSSGNDYCTVTQLCQPAGGSCTITASAGSNYVAASVNSGSNVFTWRVLLI